MRYCPACRSEYRDGFDACADCGAALVDRLKPLPTPERGPVDNPVPLLSTSSLEQALATRLLLEDHGIPCLLDNEHGPGFAIGLPGSAALYVLQVPSRELAAAREILAEAGASRGEVDDDPGFRAGLESHRRRRTWQWILAALVLLVALPASTVLGERTPAGWPILAWAAVLGGLVVYVGRRGAGLAEGGLLAMVVAGAVLGVAFGIGVPVLVYGDLLKESSALRTVAIGPALEEFGKILGVLIVFRLRPAWVRHPGSWFTAGVAAGAGFAFVENAILSLADPSQHPVVAFVSRGGSIVHVAATALLAHWLGPRPEPAPSAWMRAVPGFLMAWALHATWNGIAVLEATWLLVIYGAVLLIGFSRSMTRVFRGPAA